MLRRACITTAVIVASFTGQGLAAAEEPFPETIDGELSLVVRGPGAAPFGIASAIFGSTNLAYHLGELTQAAESGPGGWQGFEIGTSPLPADESYQGTLQFTLRKKSSSRWTLERFSFDYDFVDSTSFHEDDTSIVDAMADRGWVGWDQGVWSGPAGWQAGSKPKGELRLFRAPTSKDCEAGTVGQWLHRARAVVTNTEDWVTCYQLDLHALHPVRPTGTSQWSTPIMTISVRAKDGEVSFAGDSIIDLEELSVPPEAGAEAQEMLKQGRQLQQWLESGFLKIDLEGDWTLDRSFTGTVSDLAITEDLPYTILTGAQARERLFVPLYAVKADPGGPYTVRRGETLRLDGSGSTGRNLKYEWWFGPLKASQPEASSPQEAGTQADGEPEASSPQEAEAQANARCDELNDLINQQSQPGSGNEGARKEGMRSEVVLLASMEVILKVTDEKTGVEHVASTTATVEAREWETLFQHRSNWQVSPSGWQSMWGYPIGVAWTAEELQEVPPEKRDICHISEAFQMGENWCAAGHPERASRGADTLGVIHPHGQLGTWLDNGYTIGKVKDPDGPFDGWYYVESAALSVDREGVFNPTVRPNGPAPPGASENFWQANSRLGEDPTAIRRGVEGHEGMGSGAPASGHSLIFRDFLTMVDPAREIEKQFAGQKSELKDRADKLLDAATFCMATMSKDPINLDNWEGTYWVWDNGQKKWCLAEDKM